jgi:hypothetical protein
MGIAVRYERFILTAKKLRGGILAELSARHKGRRARSGGNL